MSNREMVLELVARLPEGTPLEEMVREIELLAGINTAREHVRRGEGTPRQRPARWWIHGRPGNAHAPIAG